MPYSPVSARLRDIRYVKQKGVVVCRHCGKFLQRGGEKLTVLRHIIATDKTHHRVAGRHDCMYAGLWVFRCASRTASLWGWAACTGRLSDHAVLRRARVTAIEPLFILTLVKNTDDELLRHR